MAVLVIPGVHAVKPLDDRATFLYGAMPTAPIVEGPVPARLEARPRDRSPLPAGVWLRFQNLGRGRYERWSAQMQIDERGGLFLVARLGTATPQGVAAPRWPKQPVQQLDGPTLADLRKSATAFAAGAVYRGHEGPADASVFVVTVALDGAEKTIIVEAHEDDFIAHLRRITHFAHSSPLPREARRR